MRLTLNVNILWIVQEQLLNADTVILRGSHLLSWDALALLCALFLKRTLPLELFEAQFAKRLSPLVTVGAGPHHFLSDVVYIWKDRQSHFPSKPRLQMVKSTSTLFSNMVMYQSRACREPRDRVFALLGISVDATRLGIIPDYTVAESLLLRDVSIRILSKARNPKVLLYASCMWDNLSRPELPSWAISHRRRQFSAVWDASPTGVTVHPQHRFQINFSADGKIMILRGRQIDSIQFASSLLYQNMRSPDVTVDLTIPAFLASLPKVLLDASSFVLPDVILALCRCIQCSPT
jgi:hypothetical protein